MWFRVAQRRPQALRLEIRFYVEPDGDRYHAYSTSLRGLHADGDTPEQAAEAFAAAIPAYLESLAKHGDPLPIGPDINVKPDEEIPPIPPGAFLHHVSVPWPSQDTSGTN